MSSRALLFVVAALAPACTVNAGTVPPPAAPAPAYYTYAPAYGAPVYGAPPVQTAPPAAASCDPATGSPAPVAHAPRFVPREPHDTVAVVSQPAPIVRPTPIVVASTPRPSPVVSRPIAHPVVVPIASQPGASQPGASQPVASRPVVRPSRDDIQRPIPPAREPARPVASRGPESRDDIERPLPRSPAANTPSLTAREPQLSSPARVVHMSRPHAQPVALRPVAVHPVVLRPSPALNRATSAENL
ncbi:MAG TPA: hypothetical protein VH062_21160 [Polyangiaceae bacterium]|jgi:hypothetical protein|nr:hypothetical protein [Polyangiaceae bacterium]